jgi:hypothetical protein
MSFNILIHDDISLDELIKISESGGRVLKTPHIGNIYPNNLAIISLGIPTLLYDRTIGSKDENFYPHKIIFSGQNEEISDPDILSTHSKIKLQPEGINLKRNIIGENIVNFHLETLKETIPDGNYFTYSNYIEENKDLVSIITKEIAKTFPEIWHRFVDVNGFVHKKQNPTTDEIISKGIFGIDNQKEGWLIPNPVNILLHGTIDVIKFNTNDIYLLSGPDMYLYMKDYEAVLGSMYSYIKSSLDLELPESINCHIIPAMKMRFITTQNNKDILDELVKLYEHYKSVDNAINDLFKGLEEQISIESLIEEKDKIKFKIIKHLEKNYDVLKKTMFYDIGNSDCFTQYDLLNSSKLYIHPWGIENKLNEVSSAFMFLNRCFKTIKKVNNKVYVDEI